MPNGTRNVPPSVLAAARAAQEGIPQGGAVPAPSGIEGVLAALKGGGMNIQMLMQLLALLAGTGQAPNMQMAERSPIEEAMMGGGGGYGE